MLESCIQQSFNWIAVITVEPADKIRFVYNCLQTRLRGQYNGKWHISLVCVSRPLVTVITAIEVIVGIKCSPRNSASWKQQKAKYIPSLLMLLFLQIQMRGNVEGTNQTRSGSFLEILQWQHSLALCRSPRKWSNSGASPWSCKGRCECQGPFAHVSSSPCLYQW